MPIVRFSIDIDGDRDFARYLLGVEQDTRNARPALTKIGRDMRRYERELFDSQGASGGMPWAPDKPATLAAKSQLRTVAGASRRRRLDPRVNHATRRLRKSLTTGGPGAIRRSTRDSLTFGTSVSYAKYAQRGTKYAPARPVLRFTKPQKKAMRQTILRWILDGTL